MRILIDTEFELGDIEHDIKNIPDLLADSSTIIDSLKKMQQYLNRLTSEYQDQYQAIRDREEKKDRKGVIELLDSLDICGPFVHDSSGPMHEQYLKNYWTVLDLVRGQIKQDLTEGQPNQGMNSTGNRPVTFGS
jgi:hypothetical protein